MQYIESVCSSCVTISHDELDWPVFKVALRKFYFRAVFWLAKLPGMQEKKTKWSLLMNKLNKGITLFCLISFIFANCRLLDMVMFSSGTLFLSSFWLKVAAFFFFFPPFLPFRIFFGEFVVLSFSVSVVAWSMLKKLIMTFESKSRHLFRTKGERRTFGKTHN